MGASSLGHTATVQKLVFPAAYTFYGQPSPLPAQSLLGVQVPGAPRPSLWGNIGLARPSKLHMAGVWPWLEGPTVLISSSVCWHPLLSKQPLENSRLSLQLVSKVSEFPRPPNSPATSAVQTQTQSLSRTHPLRAFWQNVTFVSQSSLSIGLLAPSTSARLGWGGD